MKSSDLPKTLSRIADVIGRDAAIRLAHSGWGSTSRSHRRSGYVPASMPESHPIVRTVGYRNGRKLSEHFGGRNLEFSSAIMVKKRRSNHMKFNHFDYHEFECPCCGKNETKKELIARLDIARDIAGVSFVITSGYRCAKHNLAVGGKTNSAHLSGDAADIACDNSAMRFQIIYGLLMAGFKRIGRTGDDMGIHVDIDESKPQCVLW